jgi:Domain of unknown function (DUF4402)
MTTTKKISLVAVIILLVYTGQLQAQNSNTKTGTAGCGIVKPIKLTAASALTDPNGAELNFGVIVPGVTAGSVFISHDLTWLTPNTPGTTGGTTVLTHGDDNPKAHAADWSVSGEPNFTYEVTTSNPTTLTLSDGSGTKMMMNWAPAYVLVGGVGNHVTTFGINQDPESYTNWISILNAAGQGGFSQGAVITVGAGQQPGLYVGSWSETVNYN